MSKSLYEISCEVLPWANTAQPLPEPFNRDPDYQAMRALWQVILHSRSSATARLAAIKEYNDRVRGKVTGEGEGEDEGFEAYDLMKLTPEEREQFLALLAKMKKVPGGREK